MSRLVLRTWRLLVVVIALLLISKLHDRARVSNRDLVAVVRPLFSTAASVMGQGGEEPASILDTDGDVLGLIEVTTPRADAIIGFSGPTSTAIVSDAEGRIVSVAILLSGDTEEHVQRVRTDPKFLSALVGKRRDDPRLLEGVDGVSGATLTSSAILEGIALRLRGARASLRFPGPPPLAPLSAARPEVVALRPTADGRFLLLDARGASIGSVLSTSPAADGIVGYQGPTEALLMFDEDGRAERIVVGRTYDNPPYAYDVERDPTFQRHVRGKSLEELRRSDSDAATYEGVSGATMTSVAVAKGLACRMESLEALANSAEPERRDRGDWRLLTLVVFAIGMVVTFSRLRRKKLVVTLLKLIVLGVLGFMTGDMLSMALVVGWARNGVPWTLTPGLVLMVGAALLVPALTGRQPYCERLCPFGAAQHLAMNRLPFKLTLPSALTAWLARIPGVLLIAALLTGGGLLTLDLVALEPFHAFLFRVAGVATLLIAGVGLTLSLFVPMAYCRFGCPTGALLAFVRTGRRANWRLADTLALLLIALGCFLVLKRS